MKLSEMIRHLEEAVPQKYAYEWDNVGLLCGDLQKEIRRVFLTLDVTEETLAQAVENHADCIVSHHPPIFGGLKQITTDTPTGRILLSAIEHRIALYAAHTNLDCAPCGINQRLASLFELKNPRFLEQNSSFPEAGLGVFGEISPCSLEELSQRVKTHLHTPFVRVVRASSEPIRRLAIGSGACADLIPAAIAAGADVLLTGDIKYHTALDAVQDGLSLIDAGHFPTENLSKEIFAEILSPLPIEIIFSRQTDVFTCL